MEQAIRGKKHDMDTDVMRIIASFFVVMTHIPCSYSLPRVVYFSVSRFCVPVFCMISGFYLLDRETEIKWLLKKSLRTFLLMVGWSGVYYVYELAAGELAYEGLPALGEYLLTMPASFWYFYTIIALYLFTPLLSAFARNASQREYQYILVLTFLFGSIVTLLLRSGYTPVLEEVVEKMKMDPTLGFVFCYLWAGYYKRFGLSKRGQWGLCACALAGLVVPTALFLRMGGGKSREINDLLFSFFSPIAIVQGMTFFVGIKERWRAHPVLGEKVGFWLQSFSSCTLGVWLVHPLVIELIDPWLQEAMEALQPWVTIPARAVAVFALSLLAILIIQRIPLLKRTVKL